MAIDLDVKKSVVIADDDDATLKLLEVILEKLGFKDVRAAVDGQKALIILVNTVPCLVITDIDMPVMNGLQLIHQIRRQHKFDRVPVIALTADGTKETVLKALKAGVDAYLIKGDITEKEVSQKIDEAYQKRVAKSLKQGKTYILDI